MTLETLRALLAERGYVRGVSLGTDEAWHHRTRTAVYLPRYECPSSSPRWSEYSERLRAIEVITVRPIGVHRGALVWESRWRDDADHGPRCGARLRGHPQRAVASTMAGIIGLTRARLRAGREES